MQENVAAYRHSQQTAGFRIQIDDDTSVMNIGKAIKQSMPVRSHHLGWGEA